MLITEIYSTPKHYCTANILPHDSTDQKQTFQVIILNETALFPDPLFQMYDFCDSVQKAR